MRSIEDPVLAVRMVAAEQLAAIVPQSRGAGDAATFAKSEQSSSKVDEKPQSDPLSKLFEEYLLVQSQHLDMPSVLTQLSGFQQARGNEAKAEALLLAALEKNPQASASRVNLADLYRAQGKEGAARSTLEAGIRLSERDASLWFSLALLEVREGNERRRCGRCKKRQCWKKHRATTTMYTPSPSMIRVALRKLWQR